MEASTLSFSSLALMRAFVICSVKARLASPLIGPTGLGVHWVLIVWVSSTIWIVATVWCVGRLLILSYSSFSLAHLSLSLAIILIFSLIFNWIALIRVALFSSRGEVLI